MISVCQIKSARAFLGWSAQQLADASGIGVATIRRYELQEGIPSAHARVLKAIEEAFSDHGIEFTGDPLVNPGVTLHIPKDT